MNIGMVADNSGVSAKMIRYYEETGLIPHTRRSDSGYRKYDQTDVHTLRFIRRARDLGFSTDRIKELLKLWQDRSRPSRDVKAIAINHVAELDADIAKLTSLRNAVSHLAGLCHGDDHPDCPILDGLSGDAKGESPPAT
jgi:MerR family transcriptional regulator, copper efflux regulator